MEGKNNNVPWSTFGLYSKLSPVIKLFKGEIEGKIQFPPKGTKGFGYDPIFIPSIQPFENKFLTYGEIEPKFKNLNSHRNFAFSKFLNFIINEK